MIRYAKQFDGDKVVIPTGTTWRIGCCDCGLVHDLELKRVRGGIAVEIYRNGPATGGKRNSKKLVRR